jgi:hypothetical protein
MNSEEQRWYDALVEKGHSPAMDSTGLAIFFHDVNFHNGPGCTKCLWSCCWHCDDIDKIPVCTGSFLRLTTGTWNQSLAST